MMLIKTGNWGQNDGGDRKLINCLSQLAHPLSQKKACKVSKIVLLNFHLKLEHFPSVLDRSRNRFDFCSFSLRVRRCLAFWLKECVSFVVVAAPFLRYLKINSEERATSPFIAVSTISPLVWRNLHISCQIFGSETQKLHNPSLAVIIMRFRFMSEEKKHLLDKAFYCLRFTFISGNEKRKEKMFSCDGVMIMICFSG